MGYASVVCRMMYDPVVPVRIAAVKALSRMEARGAAFAQEVSEILQDPVPDVRVEALKALACFGSEAAPYRPEVLSIQDMDPVDYVREEVGNVLAKLSVAAIGDK